MRVGLSTYTYTWAVGVPGYPVANPLDAVGLVRLAADAGIPVVQFGDNLPLHALTETELKELEQTAVETGVVLEVGTRGIGNHLTRYVELATRFGASFVRVVLDQGIDHPTPAEARQRLKAYERPFRDRGIRLAVENHDRFTTEQLAELVTALGDWAGICLDTVNSFGALESPQQVVATLGPLAINVHLKDFTVRRPAHAMGFLVEGTPAGSGWLDIPWLLTELAGTAADSAILELWTPPEHELADTVAKEDRWARESLDYLRRHTNLAFG